MREGRGKCNSRPEERLGVRRLTTEEKGHTLKVMNEMKNKESYSTCIEGLALSVLSALVSCQWSRLINLNEVCEVGSECVPDRHTVRRMTLPHDTCTAGPSREFKANCSVANNLGFVRTGKRSRIAAALLPAVIALGDVFWTIVAPVI